MNVKANCTRRAVSLLRVSTDRQGRSGLGLEAQREAVRRFLGDDWLLVDEVTEVESGRRSDRPGLMRALALCRAHGATLVIARLCRLSRDPHFLLGLEKAGVEFIAVDMPHASRLTVGLMSLLAQEEARLVSERTKTALAARRARGLAHPNNNPNIGEMSPKGAAISAAIRRGKAIERAGVLKPVIQTVRSEGAASLAQIASALNARGLPAPRGGNWHPQSVRALLALQED